MAQNFLLVTAFAAVWYSCHGAMYKFEVLEQNGAAIDIATPNPTPAGFGLDYSIRADPMEAVIQISCNTLQFGQGNNCDKSGLVINDGENEKRICSSQNGKFFYESPAGVKVKVFLRAGPGDKVVCTAKAEPNPLDKFLLFEPEDVDSNGHGVAPGMKATTCPCGSSNKARIVGGTVTKANEYPFIVGMVNVDNMFLFCGASLVTKQHALTAAHCTFKRTDKRRLAVVMGFHDIVLASVYKSGHGKVNRVSRIIEHENYDSVTLKNDIALMVLTDTVEWSNNIQPVCLPNSRIPLVDKYIKVLGWGNTASKGHGSDLLREVNLKVVPLEVCASKYSTVSMAEPAQVCTYNKGKDSCQGDSGGPLVWLDPETNRYTLVALVSFGRDCGAEMTPGINTEVGYYLPWIHKKIDATTTTDARTCTKID